MHKITTPQADLHFLLHPLVNNSEIIISSIINIFVIIFFNDDKVLLLKIVHILLLFSIKLLPNIIGLLFIIFLTPEGLLNIFIILLLSTKHFLLDIFYNRFSNHLIITIGHKSDSFKTPHFSLFPPHFAPISSDQ